MELLCPPSRRFRRSSQLGADIATRCVNCLSSPIASWMISAFAAAISNSSCDVRLRARFRPDREILKSRDAPGNRRVGPCRASLQSPGLISDTPTKPLTTPGGFVTSAPMHPIHIIGGGLAGSEAAWQAANAGVPVVLHEMRPTRTTAAHQTPHLAELVCSNSFRSDDSSTNAVGILHREMRALGSIILQSADAHQVPAGGALAVDRDGFSQAVE